MAEDTPAVRAAGYVRVSQERNARNGWGLGAQESDVARYIRFKRWEPAEVYREEGGSGYDRERPALERLLADSKAGKFDVVIFPSIDRAARSVKDMIDIEALAEDCREAMLKDIARIAEDIMDGMENA